MDFLSSPLPFREVLFFSIPPGTETAFSGNVTEEGLSRTEAPPPSENITAISVITFGTNSSVLFNDNFQTYNELSYTKLVLSDHIMIITWVMLAILGRHHRNTAIFSI